MPWAPTESIISIGCSNSEVFTFAKQTEDENAVNKMTCKLAQANATVRNLDFDEIATEFANRKAWKKTYSGQMERGEMERRRRSSV